MWLTDALYSILRGEELKKGLVKLKRVKTNTVLQCLSRECWRVNMQYKVLFKDEESLLVKIYGNRKCILFKFHKTRYLNSEELNRFLLFINQYASAYGIYVITGKLSEGVIQCRMIKVVDGTNFVKDQIGIAGRVSEIFGQKKLRFYKYLPD